MYCDNDYQERFRKTYNKICQSGLLDKVDQIFVNINNKKLQDISSILLDKVIVSNYSTSSDSEQDTLNLLRRKCAELEDGNVLYLHCKGVTKPHDKNVQSWIDYMEYFNIEQHSKCLDMLKIYDTVGVNLQEDLSRNVGKHYSGNFWWSRVKYINSHKDVDINNCTCLLMFPNSIRAYCEFWLLDNPSVNPCTLHNSNINHYSQQYDKQNYEY